jgi:3-hydroxyacyl-CoA dehydrogenase/enoyl-CoA hydratase/3-hydroxybutyryl-CoA epimerase
MSTLEPLPVAIGPDRIAVMTIGPNQGPMTVLDEALILRLEAALTGLPSNLAGFILVSGSSRVFIAGADLKAIEAMSHDELDRYLSLGQRVFGLIAALNCPTVAAINGAALGGGLELAMHCDALIAAPAAPRDGQPSKPYPIGLPEAGLSICPGWGGTNLLPARMDPADALRRTCAGRPMTLDEAHAAGLLDALAPAAEALMQTCTAWIASNPRAHEGRRDRAPLRWIGRDTSAAGTGRRAIVLSAIEQVAGEFAGNDPAQACLRACRAGMSQSWAAALDVERSELNRLRAEPAGKAAIRAFFEKSVKK